MNHSMAIFLVNPKVRAVICIYDPQEANSPPVRRVTYKTLDPDIKVDDLVIVPTGTRLKQTVNKVIEVDVQPDLESPVHMDWIIDRVDRRNYENIMADEGRLIASIKEAEVTAKREELRQKMLAHVDATKLSQLRIANMGSDKPDSDIPLYKR